MLVYGWMCRFEKSWGVDYECCRASSRYFYRDIKKAKVSAQRHERLKSHRYDDHCCDIIAVHPNCREARGKVR